MQTKVDVGVASLSKRGEEVCGDTTQVIETKDSTRVILSDGLGSGIKASILSILSTRIAARLLETDLGVEEVFETIASTLPICKVRGLAYSTLSILDINKKGEVYLIEYDNPSVILIRDSEIVNIKKETKTIAGKEIQEAFFQLQLGDVLILVSDGVINAGVGGLFPLGLGKDRLIDKILPIDMEKENSQSIADKLIALTKEFYLNAPGDDSTVVALKSRELEKIVIFTGPPGNKDADSQVVKRLLDFPAGKRIVCGGTTAQIVARELKAELKTSLDYFDSSVPPSAEIAGIDLVTEGILTLSKSLEKIKRGNREFKVKDGATILAKLLTQADEITFMLGTAVNPAHEELMKTMQIMPRNKTVGRMVNTLREIGKKIKIEVY